MMRAKGVPEQLQVVMIWFKSWQPRAVVGGMLGTIVGWVGAEVVMSIAGGTEQTNAVRGSRDGSHRPWRHSRSTRHSCERNALGSICCRFGKL